MRRTLLGAITCLIAASFASPATARPISKTPVESLSAFAARWTAAHAALQAGNCRGWNAFLRSAGYVIERQVACTAETRRRRANFRITGYRQFGTGAIIDYVDSSSPRGGIGIFALWRDRRFSIVFEQPLRRQVGTTATPRALQLFKRTANIGLSALRRRDCRLYFALFTVYSKNRPAECRKAFAGELGRELAADPYARLVRLGGTRDIQFYALHTRPEHYRTLVVSRTGKTWLYQIGHQWRLY